MTPQYTNVGAIWRACKLSLNARPVGFVVTHYDAFQLAINKGTP